MTGPSLRRSLTLFILACLLAAVLDDLLWPVLLHSVGWTAADNFLYFWFPNQLPVFTLGALVYYAIHAATAQPTPAWAAWLRRGARAMVWVGVLGFFACAYLRLPHFMTGRPPFVTQSILASICLALFVAALSQSPRSILVNPIVATIGRVSFGAYLIHFAVITFVVESHPALFHTGAVGYAAIGAYAAGWFVVVAVTCAIALVLHSTIEKPMIALGKRVGEMVGPAPQPALVSIDPTTVSRPPHD